MIAVALRSVPAALVAMLPNAFPAATVYGFLCWIGKPIDIGVMMTASVALGIAVDDTVHFLTWYRRGRAAGYSSHRAIALSFRRCAGAILQTTAICGLGLQAYLLSEFVPIHTFAALIGILLAAAVLGDLAFLPAIICSPLGRFLSTPADRKAAEPNRGDHVFP